MEYVDGLFRTIDWSRGQLQCRFPRFRNIAVNRNYFDNMAGNCRRRDVSVACNRTENRRGRRLAFASLRVCETEKESNIDVKSVRAGHYEYI
ncbi:MAG: hypothetical protein OES84_03060 [Kiritimatiellaceae bacterium]|nr:hypothetical protein [Kiritimatiellaceae bacterium]